MYQVLYRKWRPKTFSDVVGQDHITETLMSEVKNGRVSHAYLFTGSRGTGKTSCAKILAKAVNCEHPANGNPCNECAACKGIDDGSIVDVVEIDAASNNGVDNIRDLREETNYMPSSVKYRVYIIDEVHMLSSGAFNALLKTLEEPPEHVKFILATTEVHKLPSTILSRCQRFDFKRIPPEIISKRIKYVAEQENIELTDGGAQLISRISDGAMRDALSLLDRCASFSGPITEQTASEAAGIAGKEHIYALVDAMVKHDCKSAIEIINELYGNSCDMERLFSELLSHFRNMMVTLTVPDYKHLILASESEAEKIKAQAQTVTLETILSCMDILTDAVADLKKGADKRICAEMTAIKLTSPALQSDNSVLLRRISELERKVKNGTAPSAPQNADSVRAKDADISAQPEENDEYDSPPPPEEEFPSPARPIDMQKSESVSSVPQQFASEKPAETKVETANSQSGDLIVLDDWLEVLDLLSKSDPLSSGFLNKSKAYTDGKSLFIQSDNAMLKSMLKTPSFVSSVENTVYEITGKKLKPCAYEPEHQSITDERGSADVEESPLSALIKRAKDLNIQITEQ